MLTFHPVADSLYAFVGIDRRLTRFENMFQLPNGLSYNSYFLSDEKTAIIDCVDASVAEAFYDCVEEALEGRKLDYIFCNHVEPDHCATIEGLLIRYPECRLVTTALALKLLSQFYLKDFTDRAVITEEGKTISLGKHVLETIAAPHVHWPEVTFTYEQTQGWLFTADAFGSFGAPAGHFYSDAVDFSRDWLDESRRYYTNIVGRQGAHVAKALAKLEGRNIQGIYPVHGLGYRNEADIQMMLDKYRHWASYHAEEPGVVICYGSMYENSAHAADELAFALSQKGVQGIRVYDVSETDVSWIIADLFRYSHAVFFCNNYNTELYPRMDALLRELTLLNFSNHRYSLVGNMSWGGRGLAQAREILGKIPSLQEVGTSFTFKSRPNREARVALYQLAEEVATDLKQQILD